MAISILPAGPLSLAQTGQIDLAVTGNITANAVAQAAAQWQSAAGVVIGAAGACKSNAAVFGYGVAKTTTSTVLLRDQTGGIQCLCPGESEQHQIGFAGPDGNLEYAFEFVPTDGINPPQLLALRNGTIIDSRDTFTGAVARIEINNRSVSWILDGVIVAQDLTNSASLCYYRGAVDLSTPGGCLYQTQFSAESYTTNNIPVDCVKWTASAGTISQNLSGTTTYTAPAQGVAAIVTAEVVGGGSATLTINVDPDVITSTSCGNRAVTGGTIVTLDGNGGNNAKLTATGGVVVDSKTWIAPYTPGVYTLTYTSDAGAAICTVTVATQLVIEGVSNGIYDGLYPGQNKRFLANCEGAVFTCVEDPTRITTNGLFTSLNDADGDTFGAHAYTIKATGCDQEVTFKVVMNPVYPTPDVEGPVPIKWLPLTQKYATRKSEGDALCIQYTLISDQFEQRWQLNYAGLKLCAEVTAYGYQESCSPDERPAGSRAGKHEFAQRLDLFYQQVRGDAYPFWFRDRNNQLWPNVHFVSMSRDHGESYDTQQTRRVELISSPCCDEVRPSVNC